MDCGGTQILERATGELWEPTWRNHSIDGEAMAKAQSEIRRSNDDVDVPNHGPEKQPMLNPKHVVQRRNTMNPSSSGSLFADFQLQGTLLDEKPNWAPTRHGSALTAFLPKHTHRRLFFMGA